MRTLAFWTPPALITMIIAGLHRSDPVIALWASVTVLSAWKLSSIDIREHRLPNRIVGPLAAGAAAMIIGLGAFSDGERAIEAVVFAVCVFGILLALHVVANLGMGDVKCAVPFYLLLGWFGADAVRTSILTAVVAAGAVGAIVAIRQSDSRITIPFGPFMSLGLVIGVAHAAL